MVRSASYWRQKLETYKADLLAMDAQASQSRSTVELDQTKVGRLSRMDALQSQAMSTAVSARRTRDLQLIERAFLRLDRDEYGYCETCGDLIPDARLEINPLVILCIECAS